MGTSRQVRLSETLEDLSLFDCFQVDQGRFGSKSWVFTSSELQDLLDRLDAHGEELGGILQVGQGMQTGRNSVFGELTEEQLNEWGVPDRMSYVRARNSDIGRYLISDSGERLLYTEPADSFSELPAGAQSHLRGHRHALEARAAFRRGNCEWWKWTWPLHKEYLDRQRLLCPYLATDNRFALDSEKRFLGLTDTTVLYDNAQPEDLRYILGLLNSRLLTFRFRFIGKLKSGGILEYFWNSISKLPIRRIDPDDPRHILMVELVESMMHVQRELEQTTSPNTLTLLRRRSASIDSQINRLVDDLYEITQTDLASIIQVLDGDRARGRTSEDL